MELTYDENDMVALPDIEPDPHHPMNDEFNRRNARTQQVIMAQQRGMSRKHVQIVKAHHTGMTNVKVAEQLDTTPATVARVLKTPAAQRLTSLLNYYQAGLDGPTLAHRRAVLTRIMNNNEEKAPKVSLAAVQEMNKMDMNQHHMDTDSNVPQQTNITINQNFFPKTKLDE